MRLRTFLAVVVLISLSVLLTQPVDRLRSVDPTSSASAPPPSIPPPSPPLNIRRPPTTTTATLIRSALATPQTVDRDAAKHSDPRRIPWGTHAQLHGKPPAIVLFAPHKTGSTFFTSFMHDVAELLGLCWYSDNAAFMYAPSNHSKCASPSCGHRGSQRSYTSSDRGWGDCTPFAEQQLRAASACVMGVEGDRDPPQGRLSAAAKSAAAGVRCGPSGDEAPLGAQNGVAWGVVRLPDPMRRALGVLGSPPWQWYLILHQRHPGDTLVSGYHSFGWTHPAAPSANADQKKEHASLQAAIRNATVDEYVLSKASELKSKYEPYFEFLRDGKARRHPGHTQGNHADGGPVVTIRSRYEQLVTDLPAWLDTFVSSLRHSYTEQTLSMLRRELLKRHRKSFRANGKHRRSVAPGRFVAEVRPQTATELRRAHHDWWELLGY
jgi:hypothetical protein